MINFPFESEKDWSPFFQQDPFNKNNLVEGFLCHTNNDHYGSLFITSVNYESSIQCIATTPKIKYPFDHENKWHFPKAKKIERYLKLDGTNIFAFSYTDAKQNKFVSYKTRLLPFVQQSKFGPFLEMWREILKRHPSIPGYVLGSGLNLSFELWGARNPHLVRYTEPLEASLLFARKGQDILPPSSIPGFDFPSVQFRGLVDKDYVWSYQQAQAEAEATLSELEDGGGYLGMEGEVWYLQTEDGKWTPWKCKPETIEAIHWAAGGIGKNVLRATIANSFESYDVPTIENIKELLLEEFPKEEIEKVHYSIAKQLVEAIREHEFELLVLTEYRALGMSIITQKAEVMRGLSQKFARGDMKRVFSHVWNSETR